MLLQLLNLLDVIIAESKSNSSDEPESSVPHQRQTGPHISAQDAEMNITTAATMPEVDNSSKISSSGVENENETGSLNVLNNLPQAELCLLCSLLAKEGYVVYLSTAILSHIFYDLIVMFL